VINKQYNPFHLLLHLKELFLQLVYEVFLLKLVQIEYIQLDLQFQLEALFYFILLKKQKKKKKKKKNEIITFLTLFNSFRTLK